MGNAHDLSAVIAKTAGAYTSNCVARSSIICWILPLKGIAANGILPLSRTRLSSTISLPEILKPLALKLKAPPDPDHSSFGSWIKSPYWAFRSINRFLIRASAISFPSLWGTSTLILGISSPPFFDSTILL